MSKNIEMADIVRALEKVRGAPVLTSNQCWDLAQALNAAAPAVERQEPLLWVSHHLRGSLAGKHFVVEGPESAPNRQLYAEPKALYASPPAPVAVVLPIDIKQRLNDVWLFLDGQTELNGCVFGEKPEGRHQFWWRKELRAVVEDLNACLDKVKELNQ